MARCCSGLSLYEAVQRAEAAANEAAEIYSYPPAATVALFGDSYFSTDGVGQGVYDTQVNSAYNHAQGIFTWANASLGGRLTLVRNAGVAGNTTAQMLARVSNVTDLAVVPDYCIVLGGTNDMLTDVVSATTISNLTAIYEALHEKRITVVACTTPPVFSATQSRRLAQDEVNNWIRSRRESPGFIVCDWAGRWADADVGGARTGLSTDGVHPTALGAGALGKMLADAMRPYLGGSLSSLPAQNADETNAMLNGMMTGTGGGLGAGAAGSLATSWLAARQTGTGTLTLAKVARTDNIAGEWQSFTLSGTSSTYIMYQDRLTIAAAGQKWLAECEFDSLAPAGGMTRFVLQIASGSANAFTLYQGLGVGQAYPTDVAAGVIRTPPMVVTNSTTIQTGITLEGTGGSVRVSRIRARRIS